MNSDNEVLYRPVVEQASPVLPYTYAKQKGVTLLDNVLFCRQDISAETLLEVRRIMGEITAVEIVETTLFDEKLSATYQRSSGESQQIIDDIDNEVDLLSLSEELPDNEDLLASDENSPIIRLINAVLSEAVKEGASDIHIETFERMLSIRFRIDGVLRQILQPARKLAPFADTLSDYLDADNETRTSGAESEYYETLIPPRAAANQRLFSLNELALLPDLPLLPLKKIRHQLCTLPEEFQQINVNMLTEEQAPLLSALFLGGINQEDAIRLISARPRRGWVSVDAFLKEAKKQRFSLEIQSSELKPLLTVRSQYFVLYTLGRFEEQQNAMSSFVQFNPQDSKIKIYQRRYRVIE